MAVFVPSAINLHTVSPATDSLSSFGAPSDPNTTPAGGLPLDLSAASFRNTVQGGLAGYVWGLPAPIDVSTETRLLVWGVQFAQTRRIQIDTVANAGVVLRLGSGVGGTAYRDYTMFGNNSSVGSANVGSVAMVLDLSAPSPTGQTGTFDPSDVQTYGFGVTHFRMSGSSFSNPVLQRAVLLDTARNGADTIKFTGVSSFDDLITAVLGQDYTDAVGAWVSLLGTTYFIPVAFQIGDGASPTAFDDGGVQVVSPQDAAPDEPRFRHSPQGTRVYAVLRDDPSDSVTLSGGYTWGVASPWDLDVSNQSSITIDGASFTGMGEMTLGSSVSGAATFRLASGSSVRLTGASIDNSAVQGDVTLTASAGATLSGIAADSLTFEAAGTYTLIGCSIGDVFNTSGGAVTLNLSATTVGTNTGPNITLVQSANVVVTGLQPSSEVRAYLGTDPQTATELSGVENSGTSFSFTQSQAGQSGFLVVFALGFQPITLPIVYSAVDATLPVQQVVDRQFENS